MTQSNNFWKNYGFSLTLLFAMAVGCSVGVVMKKDAIVLKPLGDIFLNMLFTMVVPLVFFSIASAVAGISDGKRLGKILGWMMIVFVGTGIVASLLMIFAVQYFSPAQGIEMQMAKQLIVEPYRWSDQIVKTFSVVDFAELLTKKNIMALILFSLLTGLAALNGGVKTRPFVEFLRAGNEVITKLISYIMFYAPIGLAAYYAYLVGVFGPQLFGAYKHLMMIYYPVAIFYFFVFFTVYAGVAGGLKGMRAFWVNIIPVSFTALGTCSSMATIPVNIAAANKTGVPKEIRDVVIPIGSIIHMDGSCMTAVLKIGLLFGLFNMDFHGVAPILTAVGVALLSGMVMSGIPNGGFLSDLIIVTMYGFPMEALPVITMIGALVDPAATLVNSTGDNIASMLVARFMNGKKWMEQRDEV